MCAKRNEAGEIALISLYCLFQIGQVPAEGIFICQKENGDKEAILEADCTIEITGDPHAIWNIVGCHAPFGVCEHGGMGELGLKPMIWRILRHAVGHAHTFFASARVSHWSNRIECASHAEGFGGCGNCPRNTAIPFRKVREVAEESPHVIICTVDDDCRLHMHD